MKGLTERQLQRRERILSAARKLIAERGYDGVNIRDLAAESGVAPKTLYHQFESKENLLRTAVEERFRHTYQAIDDAVIDKGIDRLFFIIDTVASTTRNNLDYAKALAPLLSSRTSTLFATIRTNTYRKAIDQIADEGDFVDWVDVGLLTALLYRQVNPIYLSWFYQGPSANTANLVKFDTCLMLASVTKGYTSARAVETAQELQPLLEGTTTV